MVLGNDVKKFLPSELIDATNLVGPSNLEKKFTNCCKMDFLIAGVDNVMFKIEKDLNEQFGALPLPFPGMDSKYLMFIIDPQTL